MIVLNQSNVGKLMAYHTKGACCPHDEVTWLCIPCQPNGYSPTLSQALTSDTTICGYRWACANVTSPERAYSVVRAATRWRVVSGHYWPKPVPPLLTC